jgi:hypothetical protein
MADMGLLPDGTPALVGLGCQPVAPRPQNRTELGVVTVPFQLMQARPEGPTNETWRAVGDSPLECAGREDRWVRLLSADISPRPGSATALFHVGPSLVAGAENSTEFGMLTLAGPKAEWLWRSPWPLARTCGANAVLAGIDDGGGTQLVCLGSMLGEDRDKIGALDVATGAGLWESEGKAAMPPVLGPAMAGGTSAPAAVVVAHGEDRTDGIDERVIMLDVLRPSDGSVMLAAEVAHPVQQPFLGIGAVAARSRADSPGNLEFGLVTSTSTGSGGLVQRLDVLSAGEGTSTLLTVFSSQPSGRPCAARIEALHGSSDPGAWVVALLRQPTCWRADRLGQWQIEVLRVGPEVIWRSNWSGT